MRLREFTIFATLLAQAVAGCDRSRSIPLRPSEEDAGPPDAPAAVLRLRGVAPIHGPHTGETVMIVDGEGFVDTSLVVTLDGDFVGPERVSVLGTGRLSVRMPPHAPGPVDVGVRVGVAQATLPDAYTFDALAFDPDVAPTQGGQRVSIRGAGTAFEVGDSFEFDGTPCSELSIVSSTEAHCRVPSHGLGRVDVVQRRGTDAIITAAEAFEYIDAVFVTGGVSGEAIDGVLRIDVVGMAGPVSDAVVYVGDDPTTALHGRTDMDGRIVFESTGLRGPVSVHVGHECHSRTSIVGVDARQLVIPLVLHRSGGDCPRGAEGGGGPAPRGGILRGIIAFLEGEEFPAPTRRWVGVPEPRVEEQRAAYVWATLSREVGDTAGFMGVTPEEWDETRRGIPVAVGAYPGSMVLCAVAGIEPLGSDTANVDLARVQATLEPFVVGCAPPAFVPPDGTSAEVVIEMTGLLNGTVEVDVQPLPALDVENAINHAAIDATLSSEAEVFIPSFIPFISDTELIVSGSAPFMARVGRRPSGPYAIDLEGQGAIGVVSWAGLRSIARVRGGAERFVARPLGVPRFLAPTQLGSFGERSIRFAIDGDGAPNLTSIVISPDGYRFGGAIPRWYVYARGDVRDVTLPSFSETELALAPSLYQIDLTLDERDAFDFNSWTFRSLSLLLPDRSSHNRVFARIVGEVP
jgi:hypothetical protein